MDITIKTTKVHHDHSSSVILFKSVLGVPQDRYVVKSPTFLGTALQDYACTALAARFIMENLCPEREIKDYDTGHVSSVLLSDSAGLHISLTVDTTGGTGATQLGSTRMD